MNRNGFRAFLACAAAMSGTAAAQDIDIRLIALSAPSGFEETKTLPDSISNVFIGEPYFIEVWASDVGFVNTGISSVYVDLTWPAANADAVSVDPAFNYAIFQSGTIGPGIVTALGGSTVTQLGNEPVWVRIATVETTAVLGGDVTYSTGPSNDCVAAWNRGCINRSNIAFGAVTVTHNCELNTDCNDELECTSDTCVDAQCVFTPDGIDPPVLIHRDGLENETRPFSGYVDPRAESTDGGAVTLGVDSVVFVFNDPVRAVGGGPLTASSFQISTTKGLPPLISSVDASDNPVIRLSMIRPPPLNEWTTIRAVVEDFCGNPITNLGNLGPNTDEPDRIDFLFLPGDIDQNGAVEPVDLLRLRQTITGVLIPGRGLLLDYADTNRDGSIAPLDFLRYRQLLSGVPPATRRWLGETASSPRP